MAISPKDRYPSKIDTTDPTNFPEGKARNIVTPLDGTGTPWEKDLINDMFGFQQAVLQESDQTPTGMVENANDSQYLEGIKTVVNINDLSQTYNFDTVAELTSNAIEFPTEKRIYISERGGYFIFKVGGAPDGYGVLDAGGGNTAEIEDLVVKTTRGYGATTDEVTDYSGNFLAAASNTQSVQVDAGTYNIPTGDFSGDLFHSYGEVTTNNTTINVINLSSVQTIDLFISCGQSNAEGRGNLYQSPPAPHGLFINGSTISDLADPVGGADTGSMWPEFTNEWYNQTGRISAVVDSAVGGTSLIAAANPSNNWSSSGDLRGDAVIDAQAAITAINDSPIYQLGNVYFIWLQGEQDAVNINGTTITGDIYEQELEDLAVYFEAQVPEFTKMGVIQVATSGTGVGLIKVYDTDIAGFEEIRLAQKRATDDSSLMNLIYTGTSSYLSLKETYDGLHYAQSMLNKVGRCAAKGLRRPIEITNISPFLGSANAVDPDTGNSTVRTLNHTTTAFTETLIVAVSNSKRTSTSGVTKTATFNGVPMLKVGLVEDATTGLAESTMFILTKEEYGRSLDRVTGDIIVTTSSTVNFLAFTAIDARDVSFYESIGGFELAGDTATATAQTELSTYIPTLTISVGTYVGDEAVVISGTMSNSTELMDTGTSNGARNMHTLIGYSEENTVVEEKVFSTTTSAVQTEIAILTCSFRPVIKGENII